MSAGGKDLAGLTPEQKRELLASLLKKRQAGEAPFPLSYGQRGIWFLDRLGQYPGAYVTGLAWQIDQTLDLDALERALALLTRRHPMLRAVFKDADGEVLQQIQSDAQVDFQQIHLAGADQAEVQAAVHQAQTEPFDMFRQPAVRVRLFSQAGDAHVLLLTIHHLLTDFWSQSLLTRELMSAYRALANGESPAFVEPAASYRQFVLHQRQHVESDKGQQQLAYWRDQLTPLPEPLDLGYARPTNSQGLPVELDHQFNLSATHRDALLKVARDGGSTLFPLLLSAYLLLLHRYTGQSDLVVGVPMALRDRSDLAHTVGLCTNTLVLRESLNPDDSFMALLAGVRRKLNEATRHQAYPFPLLVEKLGVPRSGSRMPLIQTTFNFLSLTGSAAGLIAGSQDADDAWQPFQVDQQQGQIDLGLEVLESNDGLSVRLKYDPKLFATDVVVAMARHFGQLLTSVAANPDAPLGEIDLESPDSLDARLREVNQTHVAFERTGRAEQLIAQQAAASPERAAVAAAGGGPSVSYQELDTLAATMAAVLADAGVKPGDRVGISLQRQPLMLALTLGVWRAGAAYVPLDPGFPSQRLAFMAADAQLSLLVADRDPTGQWDPASPVLELAELERRVAEAAPLAALNLSLDDPAYIIYTSGSTGKPKGVCVAHRALTNFLNAMVTEPGLAAMDRLLAVTTLSFDIAGLELYAPLLVGAEVVIASAEQSSDGRTLAALLTQHSISVMQATPATFSLLRESGWQGRNSLKALCGGEALSQDLARWLLPRVGSLWNLYGPTETTIWSTCCQITSADQPVLIGKPIANTTVYVLDQALKPQPVGIPGELFIGGAGLAQGYWQRDELTAERFIDHPLESSTHPGGKLYRTGDRVRLLADGSLQYLDRLDNQVKVRGYRIELGEIEAVLESHPRVDRAVVLVFSASAGDQRLVGFVVGQADLDQLKAEASQRLPGYMLPASLIALDSLPLTPNNKTDRRALLALAAEQGSGAPEQAYVAPGNDLEQQLADLFAEVLGVAQVGVNDSFFSRGGHSLLLMRLVSRISGQFETDLPLDQVFKSPTVTDLAQALAAQSAVDEPDDRPTAGRGRAMQVVAAPDGAARQLSFGQQRLWFLDQLETAHGAFNLSGAIRLTGSLNEQAVTQALSALVSRHEVLRTTYHPGDNNTPVVVVHEQLAADFEQHDLSAIAGGPDAVEQALADAMARLADKPFDLTQGPLLRAALYRLDDAHHVLMMAVHHIAADGWSLGLLSRDFGAFYRSFALNQPASLPPLPVQYTDYAHWQREWLQGDELSEQLAYWQETLGGEPPALELPTDYPRPAQQAFAGARLSGRLPSSLMDKLKALGRGQGVTLYMTLLAGLKVLLARYSGQDQITVGTPVANRRQSETEDLVGLFVNSLVLSSEVDDELSFGELLGRVKEASLGAFSHQDLPFEQLVEALRPKRDLSRHPLFQVMFALQNAPFEALELPGLSLSMEPVAHGSSQFDLTLFAWESEGGLELLAEYNTALFEAATIERLLGHFETLLEAITTSPDTAVGTLKLLNRDQQQALTSWQGPQVDQPDATLNTLLTAQLTKRPEAVAVSFGEETLTYGELDRRSNQLARHLKGLGVGPGVLTGIALERSLDLLVGLLGILKAGGAYLPLDPSFPSQRLAFMLEDAGVPVLVTESSLGEQLPAHKAATVLLDEAPLEGLDDSPLPEACSAGDLAYVIYTSGSTGQPKGVQIQHGAVVNFLQSMARRPGFSSDDVLAAVTTLSFDISVLELFLPLVTGGRLVLVSRDEAMNGEALSARIKAERVSVLQATPTTWRLLLASDFEGGGLKALVGGEAWDRELADGLLTRVDLLWNMYGPTETTIWSAVNEIRAGDEPVLVGGPIDNTQLYVLSAGGQLQPVGVPGELYIGGAGLSAGYLNRPTLTAERFVEREGQRLYRTGDRVRWRADGQLEFLGRLDHQIKIRGYRIELGEIEATLKALPEVDEAVAIVREDTPGDQRLVAYLTASADVSSSDLRAYARSQLAPYMVPSQFVTLDALPLTPNRKVDRKALPAPDAATSGIPALDDTPQSETQIALADIFATVLNVPAPGIHESFFELGGHSLLATQLIGRVRERLGLELPLRALFEGPTVAELAELVDQVSGGADSAELSIVPAASDAPPRLSFGQQRLWFLDQLEGGQDSGQHSGQHSGEGAFNLSGAVRLTGPINEAALSNAITALMARHESLRTTFSQRADGEPEVVIHAQMAAELRREKLADQADPEAALAAAMAGFSDQPFDLQRGPLLRVALYQLSAQTHVLLMVVHHIVADGWSMNILSRDFGQLYAAAHTGQPASLPPLPVQYTDYAHWQRAWLQGEALSEQLAYWQETLGGEPPALELPTDYPRPAQQAFAGARLSGRLPSSLMDKLKALGRGQGVTLYMTLLAGLKVLLARYSGQDQITVGTPVANRRQSETEDLVGLFVNSLVLSSEVDDELSFGELLGRVKEASLGAFSHQDLPFEQLVEALRPKRDLSRHPLFQVMFALQNAPFEALELPGLSLSMEPVAHGSSQFDLTLFAWENEGGLELLAEYNTALFEAATIERLLGHFETLLEAITTSPDTAVGTLKLLNRDQQQALTSWQGPQVDQPDATLNTLLTAQLTKRPEAVAVSFGEETLTYGELDRRSNQLARHLKGLGVGPGVLTGIALERSLDLLVGLLGILKAGGAYLPLDPSFPSQRLAFMLEDAGVPVLVTESSLGEQLPAHEAATVLLDEAPLEGLDDSPLPEACSAGDLAYVIYTSGSTGQPKGVQIQHGAVVNFLQSMARRPGFSSDDVLAAVTTLSFDISVLELFLPLVTGGRLVLVSRDEAMNGEALSARIKAERVSVLQATPTTWRLLLASDFEGGGLKALVGGEAWDRELADGLLTRVDSLWNMYGPTETTIWSAVNEIRAGDEPVLVGGPIDNTQLYVLSAGGQLQPVGVPGELYIGGAGLSAGYLNRPTLTAERFVEREGQRLYRTGDRVRWRADGQLEFLGRLDHQIKLRGYRIELGEIEATLKALPEVDEAVAIVREDTPGDQRLVAYVTATGDDLETHRLKTQLQQLLAPYMVPARIVTLASFPLTPNNKIDRNNMPRPEEANTPSGGATTSAQPATPTERQLAAIFSQVLNVDQVGAADSFFELGGHSLLATQVIARIRDELNVELPLRTLFEHPTVADLGVHLDQAGDRHGAHDPPQDHSGLKVIPAPETDQPPLSFGQQRLWFLDQLEGDHAAFNLTSAVRLTGQLNLDAVKQAANALVDRHQVLRTTYHRGADGLPLVVIHGNLRVDVEPIDLTEEGHPEQALPRAMAAFAAGAFDLTQGPLLRGALYRLGQDSHVLLMAVHHIAADGWSLGVLSRDFGRFYRAFAEGTPPALDELPVQYTDYAHWQREWLQGDELSEQLAYWQETLGGEPPALELPTDYPRPAQQAFAGARLSGRLPSSLMDKLKALGRGQGVTLYMTLLAGLKVLLARYSGQDQITVGTPVANRRQSETEDLVGLFVNSLVLSSEVDDELSFGELLGRVKEASLGAFSHQDLPFEQLVEALRPKRDLSRHPLFQVMFALQNAPFEALELPGLSLSMEPVAHGSSQFDLTLFAWENEGGLELLAEYNTALFEAATIKRLLGHFETLLEAITTSPDTAVGTLKLLNRDQQQALTSWQGPQVDQPDATLNTLLTAQLTKRPEAVAVSFGEETLTYGELDRRSNQLARHLKGLGVGPGVLTGIALERSLDLLVGLLGILKAGGAYLPLDPSFPSQRLAFMLEDAGVPVLVTESSLGEQLPAHEAATVLLDEAPLEGLDDSPLPEACSAGDLAYVIYTSGSTGQPKGVQIQHGAVVNFLQSMARRPGFSSDDVLAAVTTLSFDISVLELFLPLVTGGRLVLVSRDEAMNGEALSARIKAERVSVLQATPTTWRLLLASDFEGGGLKALVGGEAWDRELADGLLTRVDSLWNMYGPTETTIWSAVNEIRAGDEPVLVGGPIDNTQLYVLSAGGQLQPVGVPGELYIGGAGLSAGYLNRPTLTAERFVEREGQRLYRTGDRVRWRADGQLEFLGRLDHQIKIRGYRVELGEIESVLVTHPAVDQMVVVVREDTPGDQRLVAYLTAASGASPSSSELRRHGRAALAPYMVPSLFVTLDELPLTPNRKVDRNALPAPFAKARPQGEVVAPSTPMEKQLAAIWQDVLQADQISVEDNFFDIGGHSLLSLTVIARFEEQTALHINPGDLIIKNLRQIADSFGDGETELVSTPAEQQGTESDLLAGWTEETSGSDGGVFGKLKSGLRSLRGKPGND